MKKFVQKFLAAILAIALVVTGLYPTEYVHAAVTTAAGEGLDFCNDRIGYYYAKTELEEDKKPLTFEATVKLDTSTVGDSYQFFRCGTILGNSDQQTEGTFQFGFHTKSQPYFAYIDSQGNLVEKIFTSGSQTTNNNTFRGIWAHLVIVNDSQNDQMVCYVNGSKWATCPGAIDSDLMSDLPICVGGDHRDGNEQYFKGSIKNVAIYNRELSKSEISSLYSSTNANGIVSTNDGLIAGYNLDLEANGTYPYTLVDVAGACNLTKSEHKYLTAAEAQELSGRPNDYEYSMAIVGDPQIVTAHSVAGGYAEGQVNEIYQWVADNAVSKNIKYVFNVGDTTDTGTAEQWDVGSTAVKKLNGVAPYSVARGNHDDSAGFTEHFDQTNEQMGANIVRYDGTSLLNTYQTFEVGNTPYMIVTLDFGVSKDPEEAKAIIKWANDAVKANANRKVIVTTHGYMADNGLLMDDGDPGDPTTYGFAMSGQDIWDEFISQHGNIIMTICGHMGSGALTRNVMYGKKGNKVVQLLTNFQVTDQHLAYAGDTEAPMAGIVTMLYFSNGGETVHVENVATLRSTAENEVYYQFDNKYNVQNQFSFDYGVDGDGLEFWKDYDGYYATAEAVPDFTSLPGTFEATIRAWGPEEVWRPGYILSNTDASSEKTKGDGFAFGLGLGAVPILSVVKDGVVKDYKFLLEVEEGEEPHTYGDAQYDYQFQRGAWAHLTIVNDVENNKMYCYENGILFATCDEAFEGDLQSLNPLMIGGDYRAGNNQNFKGAIKNVAIFSGVRSAEQVWSDYKNGVQGIEEGLIAAYNLSKTSENVHPYTITDLTSNGRTLTTHNLVPEGNTKEAGRGLNFATTEYDYYFTTKESTYTIPTTFEATVRLTSSFNGSNVDRGGEILSNYDAFWGKKSYEPGSNHENSTEGTFTFGLHSDSVPYFQYVPSENATPTVYKITPIEGVVPAQVFKSGAWITLSMVMDWANNTMYCYTNGALFGSCAIDAGIQGLSSNVPLCIGGDTRGGFSSGFNAQSFKGEIKDVAIFSDARTPDEIMGDYMVGIVGSEDNLMAAYELGLSKDGAIYPQTIKDKTINGLDLAKDWMTEDEAKAISGRGDYDFAMAVIGDPQIPTAYTAQGEKAGQEVGKIFQWVVDNAKDKKIKFALNMGDTTDSYAANDNEAAEWAAGAAAVKRLDGNVPYSIVRGNHDATDYYNQYFSWDEYGSSVAGSYSKDMLNTYQKIEINGNKYMILNLDFGISSNAEKAKNIIQWANDVVEANPDYNVIVTTHAYLEPDGTRTSANFLNYYGSAVTKSGEDIWNEFVKLHKNIIMVLSGHVGLDDIVQNEVTGDNGNTVIQMVINPQSVDGRTNATRPMLGGVAMLYFSEGGTKVNVEHYSVFRDQYYGAGSQFEFNLEQVGSVEKLEGKNGAVAIEYNYVTKEGTTYVPTISGYEDYLFAGWFKDVDCSFASAIKNKKDIKAGTYAKFIPKEIMQVKAQASSDVMPEGTDQAGKWGFRFVSSVESLDYNRVGFRVSWVDENGKLQTKTSTTRTVYGKIASSEAEVNCNFTPNVISEHSEYFITAKMAIDNERVAKATDYTVQAYLRTMDGTVVYGPERVVRLNDGLSQNKINMTVSAALDENASYTVSVLTGNGLSTEVATGEMEILSVGDGYSNVRISLSSRNLTSASKVIIKDAEGNTVAEDVYRNYYTKYAGGEGDYSWYNVDQSATDMYIASSADLFGFNKLISWSTYFEGKTVHQISDIVVNEGVANPGTAEAVPSWTPTEGTTQYTWSAAGGNWGTGCFNGTYDGSGNTISGLVMNETSAGAVGLFGSLNSKAVVKNLGLINSFIYTEKDYVGSIVGFSYAAKLENLYSDAVIYSTFGTSGSRSLGGIVGHMDSNAAGKESSISSCWFNGQVYYNGYAQHAGGIIGKLFDQHGSTFEVHDCLFTGELYYTGTQAYPDAAGIVPYLGGGGASTVNISNCLNTGNMVVSGSRGILCNLQQVASGSVSNCYAVESSAYTEAGYIFAGDWFDYMTDDKTPTFVVTAADNLKFAKDADLIKKLPLRPGQNESAWVCNVDENGAGIPILRAFSDYHWTYVEERTCDTSWYDASETTYTLKTKEELLGFALLAKTLNFKGKTVRLGADIVFNEGDAADWATTAPSNVWTPIKEFAGTFDGQGYTISGVYVNGTSNNNGFFGTLAATAEVCNLGIVNSYINANSYNYTGAIAGLSQAKRIENVYSDAIIHSAYDTGNWDAQSLGGLIGELNNPSKGTTITISKAWFDGQITHTGKNQKIGGIVGMVYDQFGSTINFSDCLYTGDITKTIAYSGRDCAGIASQLNGTNRAAVVNFDNCLVVGTFNATDSRGLVSDFGKSAGGYITNCWAVDSPNYATPASWNSKMFYDRGWMTARSCDVVDVETLKFVTTDAMLEKLPLLTGQKESAWVRNTTGNAVGTPILRGFAEYYWANVQNKVCDIEWYDANKTTYTLNTKEDLYGFVLLSNLTDFEGKTIQLGADIVLNEGNASDWASVAPSNVWTQIETFAGTFDGKGHTISGVYINGTSEKTGFFRTLTETAVVCNLGIVNSFINANEFDCTGTIAGQSAAAKIENVYSNAIIHSAYSTGAWTGQRLGGLVGEMITTSAGITHVISGAWFGGTIYYTGLNQQIGGLVGKVTDEHGSTFDFKDCLFSGTLQFTSGSGYREGAGILANVSTSNATLNMTNCLNTGTLIGSGSYGIGATLQAAKGGTITNCYAIESSVYPRAFYDTGTIAISNQGVKIADALKFVTEEQMLEVLPLISGQSESAWICNTEGTGAGTPILKTFAYYHWTNVQAKACDTSWYDADKNVYTLDSKEDLYGFALLSNVTNFAGKTIKLSKDITLNSGNAADWATAAPANVWTPIKEFAGTFDGQGHLISGVYVNGTSNYNGFFGTITAAAQVCNVGIVNSYINANTYNYTGSLAGLSYAKRIENVYSDAIIHSAYSTGTWSVQSLGGLIGEMNATSAGNTHVISKAWFDGQVYYTGANQKIGGIVGTIWDEYGNTYNVEDCLFSGDITMTSTSSGRDCAGMVSHLGGDGATTSNFTNCIVVGTFNAIGCRGLVASFGQAKGGAITNCWGYDSPNYATPASWNTKMYYDRGQMSATNCDVVETDALKFATKAQLLEKLPVLSGQTNSAWTCNVMGNEVGTPVLKTFAEVWQAKQLTSN